MCWLFGCLDLMRKLSSWWSQASDFTAQALTGPRIPLRQVSPWRFVRTVTALKKDSCVQVLNGSRIPLHQVSKRKLVWTMVALKKDGCEAMSNFSLFAIGCGFKKRTYPHTTGFDLPCASLLERVWLQRKAHRSVVLKKFVFVIYYQMSATSKEYNSSTQLYVCMCISVGVFGSYRFAVLCIDVIRCKNG